MLLFDIASHSGSKVIFLPQYFFFIILLFCPKVSSGSSLPIDQIPTGSKISIHLLFHLLFLCLESHYIYRLDYFPIQISYCQSPLRLGRLLFTTVSPISKGLNPITEIHSSPITSRTKSKHF